MPYILETERFFSKVETSPHQADIDAIAKSVVYEALQIQRGKRFLIRSDRRGMSLAKSIYKLSSDMSVPTGIFLNKPAFDIKDAKKRNPAEISEMFAQQKELADSADYILFIRCPTDPTLLGKSLPTDKFNAYNIAFQKAYSKIDTGKAKWTRLDWPTPYEARKEGLTNEEYFAEFLRACNQPWLRIHDAQQKLIEILNRGKELEFIVDDPDPKKRTQLRMSVAGFTFANSTIGHNYPGSEVFSAPALESVEGQFFTPERFIYQDSIIQGVHAFIKEGELLKNSYAEKGNYAFQNLLSLKGMRRFGEIGFGTNPGISRQFINAVLIEKRAGTVHLALGFCEENEVYQTLKGPQRLSANNGHIQKSAERHFDIVIPMHKGIVVLDNRAIQRNGRFLNKALSVLNPLI